MAQVEQWLDGALVGPSGLALEGAPGIGKTTLWREGVAAAERGGFQVIRTAPGEPDRSLAFAGLGDLFGGVGEGLTGGLPEPQRHALAAALLLEGESDAGAEPRALARAVLTVLQRLAERGPLVVAIDDEQWLDPASAGALGFALCRVRDECVGVLVARRAATTGELWPDLRRGFAGQGLTSLTLRPLSLQSIDRLVTERPERPLSRPLMARVHAASGGNPLYALAIAGELDAGEATGVTERDLPIPESLADALSLRLRRVDARAGPALLGVASASQPTIALLHSLIPAFKLGDLDSALQAGVIDVDGDRVRFSHPLLASTHYSNSPRALRREVHRLLAEVVDDEVERAYHLARGAEAPDRRLALIIEQTANSAARRGARRTAASLLEDAARLTPADPPEASRSRRIAAAEQYAAAGDGRSAQLLDQLLPELSSGPIRARALLAQAPLSDDWRVQENRLEQALAEAGDQHRLRAQIEVYLSDSMTGRGKFNAMAAHASSAVRSAELAHDPGLIALARGAEAMAAFVTGQPVGVDRLLEAAELEQSAPGTTWDLPSTRFAVILLFSDDLDSARPLLARAVARADDRGEEAEIGWILFHLVMLEWLAGERAEAERQRETSDRIRRDLGGWHLTWLAWEDALFSLGRGELETARSGAATAVEMGRKVEDVLAIALGEPLLASVELSLGEPAVAHDRLGRVRPSLLENGFGVLGSLTLGLWSVDIEASIALGQPEEAQPVLDDLVGRAHRSGNPNAVGVAERCRGLLLAARGEVLAGIEAMRAALVAHEQRRLEPEVARTLLELGVLQRRAKQKSAAKRSLEEALAIFEPMGAAMWVERARDELRRVGLRRAVVSDGLTPAQERVAELVAAGMSNREIASTLYMSVRSVESHLTKVYREYGVRSRAQLVASMAASETDPERRSSEKV